MSLLVALVSDCVFTVQNVQSIHVLVTQRITARHHLLPTYIPIPGSFFSRLILQMRTSTTTAIRMTSSTTKPPTPAPIATSVGLSGVVRKLPLDGEGSTVAVIVFVGKDGEAGDTTVGIIGNGYGKCL